MRDSVVKPISQTDLRPKMSGQVTSNCGAESKWCVMVGKIFGWFFVEKDRKARPARQFIVGKWGSDVGRKLVECAEPRGLLKHGRGRRDCLPGVGDEQLNVSPSTVVRSDNS